ncbi:MAG: type III-B CRISPR-associated protein Cas10/Cmr2 [Bacteroidota bacterium]
MNHLFLFTIGPVQSFIAQARKTQDLYAGSQLLSALIKKAVDTVGKEKIVFPNPSISSFPNRFVAKIDLPENELQAYGEKIEQVVKEEWKWIALGTPGSWNLSNPPGFDKQIEQHLKTHWVFKTIEDDYQVAYKEIEALLAAVKQVTPFEQYPEVGRKCSVDGAWNVKFYRRSEGQDRRDEKRIKSKHLFSEDNIIVPFADNEKLRLLQPGEGLSAISLVKRAYQLSEMEEFESTADIALLDWKKHYEEEYEAYKELFDLDDKNYFNAQFLYEDNLTQKQMSKQGIPKELIEKLPIFLEACRALTASAREQQHKLNKYYAILLFDGDNMGKLLDGNYLTTDKKLADFHHDFSEKLGLFAEEAKQYLDADNRGRTVYAGGDDFLGFVNLERLLEVLSYLRVQFNELVSKPLQSYFKANSNITFSAGICIAHYKEPLNLVLKRTRAMEKKAKDSTGKNAFAIAVIKGSGEDHSTVWGFENDNISKISKLIAQMRKEFISNTFLQQFQRLFQPLQASNELVEDTNGMYKTEFLRLAKRSVNNIFLGNEKEVIANELVESLWQELYLSSKTPLINFFELLNICDFLHRNLNSIKTEQTDEQPTT